MLLPRSRKAGRIVALVSVIALAASACGNGDDDPDVEPETAENGGDDAGQATDGELTTVSVGTLPIANSAPIYLGIQEGFFEAEGIDLEPVIAQGSPDIITGVASGAQDFGGVGYISAGIARSQGVPIRVVSASDTGGEELDTDWTVTLAAEDSPIDSIEDFEGATVSVNALGGIGEVVIRAAMDEAGLDPNSVQLIEVPFPEVPAALAEGRIDAGWTAEPFVSIILGQGGKQVDAPWLTIAPRFPVGSYVANDTFIDENPDVVERFRRAMDESVEFTQANPDAVRAILPTYTAITEELAEIIRLPIWSSEPDRDLIAESLALSEQYGVVSETPSLDELLAF